MNFGLQQRPMMERIRGYCWLQRTALRVFAIMGLLYLWIITGVRYRMGWVIGFCGHDEWSSWIHRTFRDSGAASASSICSQEGTARLSEILQRLPINTMKQDMS